MHNKLQEKYLLKSGVYQCLCKHRKANIYFSIEVHGQAEYNCWRFGSRFLPSWSSTAEWRSVSDEIAHSVPPLAGVSGWVLCHMGQCHCLSWELEMVPRERLDKFHASLSFPFLPFLYLLPSVSITVMHKILLWTSQSPSALAFSTA